MSNDLMLDVDQAGELKAAFRRARGSNGSLWTNGTIKRLSEGTLLGDVLDVLQGRSKIAPIVLSAGGEIVEGDLDPVIRTELNIKKLEFWLHPKQWIGERISGAEIYFCLKNSDMLSRCLDLRDGEEIKRRGIILFRKYFSEGRKYVLWGSVVPSDSGELVVSYLRYVGEKVLIERQFLCSFFFSDMISLIRME